MKLTPKKTVLKPREESPAFITIERLSDTERRERCAKFGIADSASVRHYNEAATGRPLAMFVTSEGLVVMTLEEHQDEAPPTPAPVVVGAELRERVRLALRELGYTAPEVALTDVPDRALSLLFVGDVRKLGELLDAGDNAERDLNAELLVEAGREVDAVKSQLAAADTLAKEISAARDEVVKRYNASEVARVQLEAEVERLKHVEQDLKAATDRLAVERAESKRQLEDAQGQIERLAALAKEAPNDA